MKMAAKKCLYKGKRRDEDDFDYCLSPCFEINSNVELKDVPTTGEEYLLKVIKEREKYATVTKCDVDLSKFAGNQSCFVQELPHAKAPDSLKPTLEWQNIQVADFSEVRMYVSKLLSKKSLWPNKVNKINIHPENVAAWKTLFAETDPKLSDVIDLHNALLDCCLEVLIDMLDDVKPGSTISQKTGQWVYAFLACMRQPLVSDTVSILRTLARKCAEIRSNLDLKDDTSKIAVAPLNIFICLVSRYFRQYDLAD